MTTHSNPKLGKKLARAIVRKLTEVRRAATLQPESNGATAIDRIVYRSSHVIGPLDDVITMLTPFAESKPQEPTP